MTTIRVKDNEPDNAPFEVAMRRSERTMDKTGQLTELRAREFTKGLLPGERAGRQLR